jgi:hypothetical protein
VLLDGRRQSLEATAGVEPRAKVLALTAIAASLGVLIRDGAGVKADHSIGPSSVQASRIARKMMYPVHIITPATKSQKA